MAEALLSVTLPGIQLHSAGLSARIGEPADPVAIELLAERGIDISRHRARQMNRPLCLSSDVILVMGTEQQRRVRGSYPEVWGRVFRIGEFSSVDVPDPYRQPRAAFEASLAIIENSIDHWVRRIQGLSS
jgi:protein-tyrosine phosphatase